MRAEHETAEARDALSERLESLKQEGAARWNRPLSPFDLAMLAVELHLSGKELKELAGLPQKLRLLPRWIKEPYPADTAALSLIGQLWHASAALLGEQNARHWLKRPQQQLDGATPLELQSPECWLQLKARAEAKCKDQREPRLVAVVPGELLEELSGNLLLAGAAAHELRGSGQFLLVLPAHHSGLEEQLRQLGHAAERLETSPTLLRLTEALT